MNVVCPRLILGVGNLLQRDDGVGIHAVRRLREAGLPSEQIEVYDGGAGGLELAVVLAGRERVVVVDAIDRGAAPGAMAWMRPAELQPAIRTGLSLHDFHLLDALAELELLGQGPRDVRILTVQVADVSSGIGLSPGVAQALDAVLRRVMRAISVDSDERVGDAVPAGGGRVKRSRGVEGVSWN